MTHPHGAIESLRRDGGLSTSSDIPVPASHAASHHHGHKARRREAPSQCSAMQGSRPQEEHGTDSDDDLDVDVAKAALATGTVAFEAREWEEADALLQEALQVLQQLPVPQRSFCNILALQYQLAICSYHILEPADAEYALLSIVQQPAISNEDRLYVYDASHHLALLYVRTGRFEDAKSECERAVQGRRRVSGKHSEAAMQSTALLAHIYGLSSNRARAKACLAIIPESHRGGVMSAVEASLGEEAEHSRDSASSTRSLSVHSLSQGSSRAGQSRLSDRDGEDSALRMNNRCRGPVPLEMSAPGAAIPQPSHPHDYADRSGLEGLRLLTVATASTEASPDEQTSAATSGTEQSAYRYFSPALEADSITPAALKTLKANPKPPKKALSRTDILRNLHCVPSDRIEEAVCNGSRSVLASLLRKKKGGSLLSKVAKTLHTKRVTALHFAALFGEVGMAEDLLEAGYNINEIPEISATRQTPLKFALGARQADMVDFLIAKGARPVEPDSWATLAGLLMDRSWLSNTLSTADREDLEQASSRIIAILKTWLKKGWNPNQPYHVSGRTLLHQAVAFESGFYRWDAHLRGTMARYLCSEGADPTCQDAKGNSPYDMATVVEDQDLLLVFEQRLKTRDVDRKLSGLAELSGTDSNILELSADTVRVELPVGDAKRRIRAVGKG